MKKIKSFEHALEVTHRPNVDFSNLPEDLRLYFENQYKAVVITEAINDGWIADYADHSQKKWFPIFYLSPSGFVFGCSICSYAYAFAGDASRLAFKSEADADHAGRTFTEIYAGIISK